MVVFGVAAGLSDTVSVALIAIGSGMFFVGIFLPVLSEFEIKATGFKAKLRERDEEVRSTLEPHTQTLLHAAEALAGNPQAGKELLERACGDLPRLAGSPPPGPNRGRDQTHRGLAPPLRRTRPIRGFTVSDPGGPSLDWDGIFQRARHHIVRRVPAARGPSRRLQRSSCSAAAPPPGTRSGAEPPTISASPATQRKGPSPQAR